MASLAVVWLGLVSALAWGQEQGPEGGEAGGGVEVPRAEQEPDPYHQQDFTAYTVEKGQWRVGLGPVDYGLLEGASVGTNSYLWLVGANARAKIHAIHTKRFDLAVEGSVVRVHDAWTAAFTGGREGVLLRVSPVGWRGSAVINPRWSLHLGNTWTLAHVEGTVSGQDIIALVERTLGGAVSPSIREAVGDSLYAGAWGNFVLAQSNFAVEWRRNRRDSWIFESNSYLWASGLVVGEVGSSTGEGKDGTEVAAGAAARFRAPLSTVPSAVSLSRQWSGERVHLRLGIPLTPLNPLSWTQAIQVYWLL